MRGRSRQVVAADRRRWTVGIRWLPRRPRWFGWGFGWKRRKRGDSSSWRDGGFEADEGTLIIVVVLVAVIFAWFFVLPVLVLLLDVLLLLLIACVAIATRVLFRRPWIVEARSGTEALEWPVVGWRNALERVDHVVARLERGLPLDDLPATR
jgi:hypothetical protein